MIVKRENKTLEETKEEKIGTSKKEKLLSRVKISEDEPVIEEIKT
jgi:hypothetical protein